MKALTWSPHMRRGLVVYLALAFGLSWTAQIAVSLWARSLGSGTAVNASLGGGILAIAVALMWPPAIAAYVTRRWVERSGFADAGLRRPAWRYVALAWLGTPALVLLTTFASLPLYPFDSEFGALRQAMQASGQSLPVSPAVIIASQLAFGVVLGPVINSLFTFGEEFGWRGYLLPRLCALVGVPRGLALHGAIWGFWHAPLILLAGHNYPNRPVLGVPLFVVAGMLMGILIGWLTLRSGSVWTAVIAHASLNAVGGAPFFLLKDVDPTIGGLLYSPVGWVVMLAAIAFGSRLGGRALARPHTVPLSG
ncbi:MAG TPA: CPBP family intramembrane glutamic endopeptidase [Chloroflexota bacterium]|nr:CPBP family intramembrane glutamic endopeptidase [Chloroflexota bacterium]